MDVDAHLTSWPTRSTVCRIPRIFRDILDAEFRDPCTSQSVIGIGLEYG
jgi:hypothetical protein